jgi:DNA-binding response OmpR family regulator
MKTILVIEDDKLLRGNITTLLDAEGFGVLEAEGGQGGLEMARWSRPDLILCDIMLPDLDGYGVLVALRADPATTAIPFLFLTAKAEPRDQLRGLQLGADQYITKPYTRHNLLTAIRVCLGNRPAAL